MSLLEIMALKISVQINNNDNTEVPKKTLQIANKCIELDLFLIFFLCRC